MTKAPINLQDLRRSLYVKAKAEPSWRFWGLYVHVCKRETLREAYRLAKVNDGAPGIDGVTFEAILATVGQNTNGETHSLAETPADDGILSLVIDRNEPVGAYQVLLRFDPTVVQFSQDDILGGSAVGFDSRPLAVAM